MAERLGIIHQATPAPTPFRLLESGWSPVMERGSVEGGHGSAIKADGLAFLYFLSPNLFLLENGGIISPLGMRSQNLRILGQESACWAFQEAPPPGPELKSQL